MSLGKEDEKNSAELDRKRVAMLLLGNLDLLSQTLRGPVVPLVCGFIRRVNLQAWRELFRNLYKRKSRK